MGLPIGEHLTHEPINGDIRMGLPIGGRLSHEPLNRELRMALPIGGHLSHQLLNRELQIGLAFGGHLSNEPLNRELLMGEPIIGGHLMGEAKLEEPIKGEPQLVTFILKGSVPQFPSILAVGFLFLLLIIPLQSYLSYNLEVIGIMEVEKILPLHLILHHFCSLQVNVVFVLFSLNRTLWHFSN